MSSLVPAQCLYQLTPTKISHKRVRTRSKMLNMRSIPASTTKATKRQNALRQRFRDTYGVWPDFIARAPGRVNIIGEHIDYCGLPVFPMAIEYDCLIAVKATAEGHPVKLADVQDEKYESCEFSYSSDNVVDIDPKEHRWSNYFKCGYKGAIEAIGLSNPKGMLCLVDENIPPCAGLSSSSALVCCATLATMKANERVLTSKEIVDASVASERYIGLNGGGMDQTCSIMAQKGSALFIEFQPKMITTSTLLPKTDPGICFVIANTLVVSDKSATAPICYNLRVVETKAGALILAKHLGLSKHPDCESADPLTFKGVMDAYFEIRRTDDSKKPHTANDASMWIDRLNIMLKACENAFEKYPDGYTFEDMSRALGMTPTQLRTKIHADRFPVRAEKFQLLKRSLHVYSEALRVVSFRQICDTSNEQSEPTSDIPTIEKLGNLMNESQDSCHNLFDCSCPKINELCTIARKAGSLGSRLTGAGWGGCTVHLLPETRVSGFIQEVKERFYNVRYPNLCNDELDQAIFPTHPGGGADIF